MSAELQLLSRTGCGLCEEMAQALHPVLAAAGVQLGVIDVDHDAERLRRYGLRVPVLLDAWDEVVCEGHFDADALQDWLRERRRRSAV